MALRVIDGGKGKGGAGGREGEGDPGQVEKDRSERPAVTALAIRGEPAGGAGGEGRRGAGGGEGRRGDGRRGDVGGEAGREEAVIDAEAREPEGPPEPGGPRRLAPGAPLSPGTLPLELAVHLRGGEPLVWWGSKTEISARPVLAVAGICGVIALLVTAFSPEFWAQPWDSLWPPLAALFSAVPVVLMREVMGRRSILVTDTSVVEVSRRGEVQRVAFDGVKRVRRDLLTGGILLEGGAGQRVRVPPEIAEDARRAIASQQRGRIRPTAIDDPLGWLP